MTLGHVQVMGLTAAAWTYFAELALVVCLVPPPRMLLTDFFSNRLNRTDAERWRRFAQLVDVPLPAWAATRPFRGPPPECLSMNRNFHGCDAFWRGYHDFWRTHDRSDRGLPVRPPLPPVLAAGATRLSYLTPMASPMAGAAATRAPTCAARARPLVLLAGQGATGVGAYAWAAQQLGLAVGRWETLLCPHTMEADECARRERSWASFRAAVWRLRQSEYDSFDFCTALQDVDAVGDIPIPQLLPFIFAAHSDAKVVLTVQNSVQWYRQRVQSQHGVHAAPFYWMMGRGLWQIYPPDTATGQMGHPVSHPEAAQAQAEHSVASVAWAASQLGDGAAWSYVTEIALIMCTVPPSRNLRRAARTRYRYVPRLPAGWLTVSVAACSVCVLCACPPSVAAAAELLLDNLFVDEQPSSATRWQALARLLRVPQPAWGAYRPFRAAAEPPFHPPQQPPLPTSSPLPPPVYPPPEPLQPPSQPPSPCTSPRPPAVVAAPVVAAPMVTAPARSAVGRPSVGDVAAPSQGFAGSSAPPSIDLAPSTAIDGAGVIDQPHSISNAEAATTNEHQDGERPSFNPSSAPLLMRLLPGGLAALAIGAGIGILYTRFSHKARWVKGATASAKASTAAVARAAAVAATEAAASVTAGAAAVRTAARSAGVPTKPRRGMRVARSEQEARDAHDDAEDSDADDRDDDGAGTSAPKSEAGDGDHGGSGSNPTLKPPEPESQAAHKKREPTPQMSERALLD